MKFLIKDINQIVNEEHIRKLLYRYEIEDLLNNEDEYYKGFYNLDSQFACIRKALEGDIEEVIKMLEENWDVPIEIIEK